MAGAKRPPLPLVLTGNEVVIGDIVFYDGKDWTRDPKAALVATDEAGAAELERVLQERGIELVEPFLTTIGLDDQGRAEPVHYRDQIRATGPTVLSHAERPFADAGAF